MTFQAAIWARDKKLKLAQKAVLMALAIRANEDGECWPNLSTLMNDSGVSDKHTIIKTLKELERLGLICTEKKFGTVTHYFLAETGVENHTGTGVENHTGVESYTGVKNHTGTGVKNHTTPVWKITPEVDKKGKEKGKGKHRVIVGLTSDPDGLASDRENEKNTIPEKNNESHGTRLSDDWKLPKTWGDWSVSECKFDENRVRTIAATFSDYWHSQPGMKGRKADWFATWRNWCRREIENSNRFTTRTFTQKTKGELIFEKNKEAALEFLKMTGEQHERV
jgi:hypothetical protein